MCERRDISGQRLARYSCELDWKWSMTRMKVTREWKWRAKTSLETVYGIYLCRFKLSPCYLIGVSSFGFIYKNNIKNQENTICWSSFLSHLRSSSSFDLESIFRLNKWYQSLWILSTVKKLPTWPFLRSYISYRCWWIELEKVWIAMALFTMQAKKNSVSNPDQRSLRR